MRIDEKSTNFENEKLQRQASSMERGAGRWAFWEVGLYLLYKECSELRASGNSLKRLMHIKEHVCEQRHVFLWHLTHERSTASPCAIVSDGLLCGIANLMACTFTLLRPMMYAVI